MKYRFKLQVCGYELDSYGHVNNAVYLNYTEQARWQILKETGLLDSLLHQHYFLVVAETNIRYMRELKLFDEVEIETTIEHVAPYLIFKHQIYNTLTKFKAAKAEVKTILIDKDRISQDIPEELLSII